MGRPLADELRAIVGPDNVLDRLADLQTYEYDAYLERSVPRAVVFVRSTEEVSAVLKVLAREGIPFVPRGCGTNLSGGSLALDGAVVIEMGRMSKVLEIDMPNQRMTVQVGIFNLDISTILSPLGYYYAPDPASQKACSLGGNIAENAGGPHCFKYGVTSNHVLGIEVVLPGGEIVWLGGKNVDPLGLDLTGVFVGSEGTLGIATTAILRILRKPEAVKTMLAVCDSLEDGGNVVSAIVAAGLVPATLEMVDNRTINAIEDSMTCGFPRDASAVLLIELDGLRDGMDEMAEDITRICRANGVREVRVAKDEDERAALWRGRKGAFGSISRLAPNYMVADGTVPRTQLPEALRRVAEIGCRYDLKIASVFHAGDGNLHPLLLFDSRDPADREKVMAAGMEVLKVCADLGGTVSGEHGIGVEKLAALSLVFTESDLKAQGLVKDAFDPKGLANPGKLLRGWRPSRRRTPRLPAERGRRRAPARGGGDRCLASRVTRPADEAQLGEILAQANSDGTACRIAGGSTKLEWGNPGRFDLLLSTAGLHGCTDVDADNLTLSAAAGTTVAEARAQADAVNRILPLDPGHPGRATIGGVAATGDQGARAAGYGGLRDVVLGIRATLADGSAVKFGGRTMKNVTGYDMTKLFVGSFGVLGVITEVTFRLLPRYDTQALVVLPLPSLEEAKASVARVLASYLQPLALEVVSADALPPTLPAAPPSCPAGRGAAAPATAGAPAAGARPLLLAGFGGHRAAVDRSIREVTEAHSGSRPADTAGRGRPRRYTSIWPTLGRGRATAAGRARRQRWRRGPPRAAGKRPHQPGARRGPSGAGLRRMRTV